MTGGGLGIGRATCLAMAREGAKVVVADIDDEAATNVVSEISGGGGTAAFWHVDVASEKEVREVFAKVEAFRKQLDEAHPIGHVGEPDDIALGIVYLASDEAKFVTGSELVIDGGYTAR